MELTRGKLLWHDVGGAGAINRVAPIVAEARQEGRQIGHDSPFVDADDLQVSRGTVVSIHLATCAGGCEGVRAGSLRNEIASIVGDLDAITGSGVGRSNSRGAIVDVGAGENGLVPC